MKSNTQPESTLTQLPGDTHCSTHQTLTPTSPIWLRSKSSDLMVWLMHNVSAKTWKRCKRSVKQMTRGKTESKNLPKGIQVIRSEWSIWQSCSRILQALREKTPRFVDSKTKSKMWTPSGGQWGKNKKLAAPKKIGSHFVFELALTATEGII